MKKNLFICVFFIILTLSSYAQTRITFIGTSITEGYGTEKPYAEQLQLLLGSNYLVSNFGVSGTTMLKHGNSPYWNQNAYQQALLSNPDIVFIDLGCNDAKAENRSYYIGKPYNQDELIRDSKDIIRSFKELDSHPQIFVLLPTAFFVTDVNYIYDPVSLGEVAPRLQIAAYEENVEVIDMHPLLVELPDLVPDKVHPNTEAHGILAKRLYQQLKLTFDKTFDIFSYLNKEEITYEESNYKGYSCASFSFEGKNAKVVKPKNAEVGHPCIWRASHWDQASLLDVVLLERGFHLVYCDQEGLNNSTWNNLYSFLIEGGLNEKIIWEGQGAGATYALNWAADNPDHVAMIYLDNPEIEQFIKNQPDKIDRIVEGDYPILLLYSELDETAPNDQNAFLFRNLITEKGGKISLWEKQGKAHTDYGLPDPSVIVDFITDVLGISLPKNLALDMPVTASGVADNCPAKNVTDGSMGTRWSSAYSNNQWIYVDLGSKKLITEIKLYWEAAYGKSYKLQVSDDAQKWTDIYTQTNGKGGAETITFPENVYGRYVRMQGVLRALTSYGYSLWEIEVYGSDASGGEVKITTPDSKHQMGLFLSPTKDYLFIDYLAAENSKLTISVISINGSLVKQFKQDAKAGINQWTLNLPAISNGIYIVRLVSNSDIYSKKIII